jgi:hypothetical protein
LHLQYGENPLDWVESASSPVSIRPRVMGSRAPIRLSLREIDSTTSTISIEIIFYLLERICQVKRGGNPFHSDIVRQEGRPEQGNIRCISIRLLEDFVILYGVGCLKLRKVSSTRGLESNHDGLLPKIPGGNGKKVWVTILNEAKPSKKALKRHFVLHV